MYFSIHQVYALLCFIFMCLTAMGQPESLFENYDGKLHDETSLARDKSIKEINIFYSIGDDSCLNSVLKFDARGNLLSRKNYSCIKEEHNLVYHETFKYNSQDSVVHEHFVSMHSGSKFEHIKDHSYKRVKDTIVKTTIISDSSRVWDSIITKYSTNGRIYSVTKNNPNKSRGITKSRIKEEYEYKGPLILSIKSELASNNSAIYNYDKTNRLISINTITGSGIVNENTEFIYDDNGNIKAHARSFPDDMRTEYDFNNENRLVERRYYEYNDDKKDLNLVSKNVYSYNKKGLIHKVNIELTKYNYSTVATIYYTFR